jgi:twinkle protein
VKVAYLGFEESTTTTYERMLSEAMGQPMYRRNEEWRVEHQEKVKAAAKTFASNLFLIDKFGSIDFDIFLANVRHYVLNEQCPIVVLDHFSILADGIDLRSDQRRVIDKAIKELKELAMELRFTFIVVCHIARNNSGATPAEEGGEPHIGLLKGSSSLGQIPDYIWMLQRNPNDKERNNLTHCWLKKNRVTGEVGMKCMLEYNINTCQFTETHEGVTAI